MSSKLIIRFVMKEKSKAIKLDKKTALYCRITLNKKRASYDFATDIKLLPSQWCAKSQTITGKDSRLYNQRILFIHNGILEKYNHLLHLNLNFDANYLLNEYLGKHDKKISLLDMYGRFIEKNKVEKNKNTVNKYLYQVRKLEKYLTHLKKIDLDIKLVDTDFAKKFIEFCQKNSSREHALKQIDLLKRVIKQAMEENYLKNNPLEHYKEPRKRTVKTPSYLTEQEIRIIENTLFGSEVLQIASDLFIFQCYTGFSYADLVDFDFDKHTLKEKNGQIWISKLRVKMEGREHCELAELPFFPQAQRILSKYNGKLPYLRNDHYNNYLKQIQKICNIPKRLHTHLARKTAGDRWLNMGISLEVVAKMLGHQSPVTTSKHYAKVRRERVSNEISKLSF